MKIILVYDIELLEKKDQNRLNRARKVARKYLHHIQKSVFEGELTLGQLKKLEFEIMRVVDKKRDSVIMYILNDSVKWERKILTEIEDPTTNIF